MGSTIVQVVVLISVLASFVLAYLSYFSMRIYNIVMMMFVFLAAITFCYFAARTLKTHQSWREAARDRQKELESWEKKNLELAEGAEYGSQDDEVNIRKLKAELDGLALDRGGVWQYVKPDKIKADTGAVTVSMASAADANDVHGLDGMDEKMVVFIFDASRYLGEFKVVKAGKKSDDLEPNLPMDPSELNRVGNSKGPWTVYQTMPTDDPRVFADPNKDPKMGPDLRQQMLPKEVLAEYSKADRPLRDYQMIFHFNSQRRNLIQADIASLDDKIKRTTAAVAKVEEEIKYRKEEKAELEFDKKNFLRERDAITAYTKKVQEQLLRVRSQRSKLEADNIKAAQELAALQLKAAEEINRRTNAERVKTGPLATQP